MSDQANDNCSAFDSAEYDKKIMQTIPYYQDFYREIINLLKVYKTDNLSWMDVGCGTGKMAEAAFSGFDIKRFAFVDSSPKMIDIVRERFGETKSEFNHCNVLELRYTNEFDVITAVMVNHYLRKEDKILALKKYYASLNENGIYIGFENFLPFSEEGKQLGLEKWKAFQLHRGKTQEECEEHINRFGVSYFPITLSEHLEILKSAGFDAAEVFWVSNLQAGVYGIKRKEWQQTWKRI
ncbi:MAG: class I SAM-dependent methyltransferase [Lachnospiraceae bacterium]|nr:class I SAM-dependent methyltransferase [Lachnospiraceae bacterium]